MPQDNTSAKLSIACGEDCSQRDRVKTRLGKYICKPCYEKVKSKKAAAVARSAEAGSKNGSSPSFDLSLMQELADQERTAPALDVVASICPSCRQPRERWAPICLECGYNMQTGLKVNLSKLKK